MPPTKKNDKTEEKTDALVTQGATALAPTSTAASTFAPLAGFDADSREGKEGIESTDMRIPFLSVAQKTSLALDSSEDAYIDGLEFADMYNSETKDIYGKGPLTFIPLRHRKRAYLPDENGRMGEAIDWNDPRCEWPSEAEKKAGKDKPEGVRVYDWMVLLKVNGDLQLAVVSFKSKSFAAGQSLATFVNMVKGAAYTAQFTIKSNEDKNDAGKFAKFSVQPAGKPTPDEATAAAGWYAIVKDKEIVSEDQVKSKVASEAAEGTVVEGTVVTPKADEKIPF